MSPREVVAFFGGTQVKTAEALNIKQSSISAWFRSGYVPMGRQYEIQILTGGKLRADPDSVPDRKVAA